MNRILQLTASVFLGLLSVLLVMRLVSPISKNLSLDVKTTNLPESHTVTVTGEGKVTVVPDIATVNLTVHSEAKTVKDVTKDNSEKMNKVTAGMKALGIDDKDMKTSGYNLAQKTDYTDGKSVFAGYTLDQTLALKIRDLNKVDDVLDQGTQLGANQVYGLNFTLDDDFKVKSDAREKAFADAKAKAEAMASAAGVKLGNVVTFSENNGGPTPPMYYAKSAGFASADVASSPDIQSGSQDYTVDVNMTFEIQ